ncbi:hypothetical protein BGZ98_008336 [Dissophora globulifera]|nr:hypothetical protein BGZ98_008336 [Dissophora globulifera]
MVPIQSLRLEKSFVRVSGRIVRAPEVKAFPDRGDSQKLRWIQSFTIKDDLDTIDVKFWHKTQDHLDSYSFISLNQVVHIWTDDVKINTSTNSATVGLTARGPATSSPFCLSLSENKIGHRIDLGSEVEMASMFKTALGANAGGIVSCVSIKQVLSALQAIGGQRFNLVICVKKMVSSGIIKSKNGPLIKTLLTVFDAQGQEASMVDLYNMQPQIKVGYQTHIQVDPACKNVEWLRHFAAQCSTLPDELNPGNTHSDRIRAYYRIADISTCAKLAGRMDKSFGIAFAILSEFDIENRSAEILTAKWATITSYKIEACPGCNVLPKGEESWTFSLARNVSFMDNTAELRHPNISSATAQSMLGCKPHEFNALSMQERTQLKVCWSDFKKQQIVQVIAMELANLQELETVNGL